MKSKPPIFLFIFPGVLDFLACAPFFTSPLPQTRNANRLTAVTPNIQMNMIGYYYITMSVLIAYIFCLRHVLDLAKTFNYELFML